MSRTNKGSKAMGWEFWSRRAKGIFNGWGQSRTKNQSSIKQDTNRFERRKIKQELLNGKD